MALLANTSSFIISLIVVLAIGIFVVGHGNDTYFTLYNLAVWIVSAIIFNFSLSNSIFDSGWDSIVQSISAGLFIGSIVYMDYTL